MMVKRFKPNNNDSCSNGISFSPGEASSDFAADSTLVLNNITDTVENNIEKLELLLLQLQGNEDRIIKMSRKAEEDIDDALDSLLSKIIKLISRKKREMKVQVNTSIVFKPILIFNLILF